MLENDFDVNSFVNQKLNEVKASLDNELLSNPRFDDEFTKEMTYIYFRTNDRNLSVVVSFDKKSVSISSYSPIQVTSFEKLKGRSKSFVSSVFYIKDENLHIEYSEGVLYDRRDLEECGIKTATTYETKLETSYSLKCINKYGIEYSNSSYTDSYPFLKPIDEMDAREQTLSSFHKPVFYEYLLPKASIHVLNAQARNTYRKPGSFAVIHTNVATITKQGYKDTACALYTTHPVYPELLRGDQNIAKAVEHDGKYTFVIQEDYAISIDKAYERAQKELKETLEMNKNNFNPGVYEYLINNL